MNEHNKPNRERGIIAIVVGVGAVVLLSFAALAIDVGYGLVTKAELQNAADAGAAAGGRELGRLYTDLGNVDHKKYTLTASDKSRIAAAVGQYTRQNRAAGTLIEVGESDLVYGRWSVKDQTFTETPTGVNTVKVVARRDEVSNGVVPTLLASIAGVEHFALRATAGEALSGVSKVPAGASDFPVGISRQWFLQRDSPCGNDSQVMLYPTGTTTGCAGWHTFTDSPASAARLGNVLKGLANDTYQSPEFKVGDVFFNFTGGTLASRFPDMQALYDAKKGPDGSWLVYIPVYDAYDCSNPQGSIKIVGLTAARITKVTTAPEKEIHAKIECSIAQFGKGGGPDDYGTLVTNPMTIQ
jgi:Flp pilus assembly protein TadG